MEKDESKKDLLFPKEDIFLEHLNHNNNPLKNEEFIKGSLETFDKFFSEEETIKNSNKNINQSIDYSPVSYGNNCFNFNEKFFNGGKEKNISSKEFIKDKINENNTETIKPKTQLFNTLQESEMITDLKKRKLIMNRESAKKSRLKKKKYIENLEKEYFILKEELIRLNSLENQNNKNNSDIINEGNSNNNIIENIIEHNKNIINFDMDLKFNINNHKDKEIVSLKKEEFKIISNNLEKDTKVINNYINKQKKILQNLLVKQIDIMTPISIKDFQNKFLKLEEIKKDDSISVIKNKINHNLEAIIELYDINVNENKDNININSKNSKGFNIYIFYNSLKSYIEQYEFIYNQIDNYNSL